MKKYMKPIMESEAFVSNEYVATCWDASCECGSLTEISAESSTIAAQIFTGGNVYPLEQINPSNFIFDGTLYGKDGCASVGNSDNHNDSTWVKRINGFISFLNWILPDEWDLDLLPTSGIDGAHHHVNVIKTQSTNHPNAS